MSRFLLRHGIRSFYLFALVVITSCENFSTLTPAPPSDAPIPSAVEASVLDSGPTTVLAVDHIPNAQPVKEPRSAIGNRSPYTVNGKTYRIIENSKGFEQVGYASWYGKKFHGQRTSNGEIYDMYGMTAAHKTLPIPCFVELTNIENGSKVVVRINDRGPFHGDRIIDLTYTAARKLGIAKSGTGKVKLRVIEPSDQAHFAGLGEHHSEQLALTNNQAPKPRNSGGYEIPERTYLQLGAFSELARAKNLQYGAAKLTTYPVSIEPVVEKAIYRVLLGPLKDNWDLVHLQKHFVANGFIEPKIVYR